MFTAPTISCNRHFVPAEKEEGFVSKFEEVRGILEGYTNPFKVIGGWRIEKEKMDGKERRNGHYSPGLIRWTIIWHSRTRSRFKNIEKLSALWRALK